MSYIVIFNTSCKDAEILTNDHGFIEHFPNGDAAIKAAEEWLDEKQYRDFSLFEEVEE